MTDHLERNNLIGSSQHDFMHRKSCTTNLMEFLQKAITAVERGEALDIIYLDFTKIFDRAPHEQLIKKLKTHGVRRQHYSG